MTDSLIRKQQYIDYNHQQNYQLEMEIFIEIFKRI